MSQASSTYDVIVIGGGILGASHAWAASDRGLKTLLIERGDAPGEASVRNFGTIVPSAMTPGLWHELALQTVQRYLAAAEEVPFRLQRGGTLYVSSTPAQRAVLEEFAGLGPARGYDCNLLDPQTALELNPAVNPAHCLAALHFPGDLRVNPRELMPALLNWLATARGCRILTRTVATNVVPEGDGCAVTTAAGERFHAAHVFVCTGADFRTFLPDRFAAAGLRRCKLIMMRTEPQPELRLTTTLASGLSIGWYPSFRICPSHPLLADDPAPTGVRERGIHVLMVQDADGRVVIGDSHEYSAGDFSDTLDAQTESLILGVARDLARLPRWDLAHRWHGILALHPDKPIHAESVAGHIHVLTGIAGKGMTTAPAVAVRCVDTVLSGNGIDGTLTPSGDFGSETQYSTGSTRDSS